MNIVKAFFGTPQKLLANIAQFLLGTFLITFLCCIWNLFFPTDEPNFLIGIVSEVEIFEVWFDALSKIYKSSRQLLVGNYLELLINAFKLSLYETAIIAICIDFCKSVGTKAEMRGTSIIQTIIGCFLGCFILKLSNDYELSLILWTIALLIIDCLVAFFMGKKLLGTWVNIFFSAIIAGMVSAYIVVNILIMQGGIQDLTYALGLLGTILFPMLIIMLLQQFFSNLLT